MAIFLGIDPGSRVTGYGLVNAVGNRLEFVGCGRIKTSSESQPERLKTIFDGICSVIEEFSPQYAAVEEVFMGKNAASALKLGQARGSAMVGCLHHNLEVGEYSARMVKLAVVGSGSATKAQVQHMVKAILGIDDTLAEDASDGLAIAICHANTYASLIKMAGANRFSRKRFK